MFNKPEDFFILILLCIPILAIVGGIVVGIVKVIGQQRQIELVQRERIAAIEHGIDPSKLPPLSAAVPNEDYVSRLFMSPAERARRQSQGLMIGGILTLAVGGGLIALFTITEEQGHAWAIGIIPCAIGLALLLSAWLVRPRGNGTGSSLPPHAG